MAAGKREFEAEIEAVYPGLVRAATVLCWSSSEVEDVVQETIMRAFTAYSSYEGRSSFFTWIYSILARVAGMANRRQVRTLPPDYAVSQEWTLPPIDRAIMIEEEVSLVINAIRSLPERQREIITLHFLQEFTYDEIAVALGIAPGTVKATIFAARKNLRALLTRKSNPKESP